LLFTPAQSRHFSRTSENGEHALQSGKDVKLSSYQGLFGKPVVVYFYPSDGSPGCTKQANAFKDSISAFKSKGAEGAHTAMLQL